MANSELCKHCGYQETPHDLGTAVLENGRRCTGFVSTVAHKSECPILDCNGNCDQRIALQRRQEEPALGASVLIMVLPKGGLLIWGD
jgi:hypothetical protein